jgi:Glycosyl transferase family 1
VKHQFEQIFNAYWLERMGYGAYWEELNKERLESFLYNLPQFREKLIDYPRQGNAALLQKVDELVAQYISSQAAITGR